MYDFREFGVFYQITIHAFADHVHNMPFLAVYREDDDFHVRKKLFELAGWCLAVFISDSARVEQYDLRRWCYNIQLLQKIAAVGGFHIDIDTFKSIEKGDQAFPNSRWSSAMAT